MEIYFTSDTHYSSERHLKTNFRPFSSVEEMDKTLIDNHNKVVKKDDIVYHLGDFGNYEIVKKLNGRIILIMGNYEEYDLEHKFKKNFHEFKNYLLGLGFEKVYSCDAYYKDVHLCHKPSQCIHGVFNCFGHIHSTVKIKKFGLNVGADIHHFYPVSIKLVEQIKDHLVEWYDDEVFGPSDSAYRTATINRLKTEYKKYGYLVIAYDFDDTVHALHNPVCESTIIPTINTIKRLEKIFHNTCTFIVFTCRPEEEYEYVKSFLNSRDIPYHYINENDPKINLKTSNKIFYNIFLEDRAGLQETIEILNKLCDDFEKENKWDI